MSLAGTLVLRMNHDKGRSGDVARGRQVSRTMLSRLNRSGHAASWVCPCVTPMCSLWMNATRAAIALSPVTVSPVRQERPLIDAAVDLSRVLKLECHHREPV
jgi:hypothetical protein